VSKTFYDNLRRTTKSVADYTGGPPADSSDQTTEFAYDGDNHVTLVQADLSGGGTEQTHHNYGVAGSVITTNDLLGSVVYPTGAPANTETYGYNALGEATSYTDRLATTHAYTFDVLGREVSDTATITSSQVDASVQRLDTAYDTQGNPYRFTSYADAAGTSLVNQVQRSFNGLGQLTAETQTHPAAQQGIVQYTYSNMLDGQGHYANHSRPTGMIYPSGRTVAEGYGTAGGLDDSISRLDALIDQGGAGPTLEALTYLGLNTVVQRAHPEANLTLSYINAPGGSTDGGDQYTGLDRFGRVVAQDWSVGATATDSFLYTYDRDSSPLTRTNALQGALSEQFAYDGLNRVTSFTLGGHSQSWVLDSQGNWQTYTTDGQAQTRTHNAQNQIASLTQPGLGTPGYDADGNTTTDEYGDTFKFDAWNRLVRATTAGGTAYGYSYDALGRRITSQVNTGSTTDLYYSASWQVVEEQVNGAMTAQYVWSPVYVDALVERDTASGRLYVQQDAGWDVTAVVDTTGAVRERYAYNPYGKAGFLDPGTWQVHGGGTYGQSSVGWAYLHQGGRYERYNDKAGTYLFRHRDFSPTLGRWLQQDPLAYAGSRTNLYQDAGSNPVVYVDPTGLSWSSTARRSERWTGHHCSTQTRRMTVHPAISKLLSIAGEPVGSLVNVDEAVQYLGRWGALGKELAEILSRRNGFYAYESALLVRPLRHQGPPVGLLEWNGHGLWRDQYVVDLSEVLFFAEDIFGGQFCLRGDQVCSFDPETGLFEVTGASLGGWINDLLADYEFRTGYPLAHGWQVMNAPLPPGVRLLPKTPFVCGGKYEVENLYPLNDVKAMRFRASIANQIRDLPDGSQIILEVSPPVP
jgi:RHS repeat-associated protein